MTWLKKRAQQREEDPSNPVAAERRRLEAAQKELHRAKQNTKHLKANVKVVKAALPPDQLGPILEDIFQRKGDTK